MNKNKHKYLLFYLLLLANTFSYAQDYDWARQIGGKGYDQAQCLGVDSEGNAYVAGTFEKTVLVEDDTLKASWFKDVFLAKYDTLGNLLWQKTARGPSPDVVSDLSIDDEGNVYLTGIFKYWIAFDKEVLIAEDQDGSDLFLVKYNKEGEVLWAKREGGLGFDGGYALACRDTSVYLMGTFTHLLNEQEEGALEKEKGNHLFLAKYTGSGDLIWVKPTLGKGKIFGNAIVLGKNGMIFITGTYGGDVRFSKDSLPSDGGIFAAKYTDKGEILLAKKIFQTGIRGFGSDLVINDSGQLFLSGAISVDSLKKKDQKTPPHDSFLSRLNKETLAVDWSYEASSTGSDKGMGLASYKDEIFLTGWFSNRCKFGEDTTLIAFQGNDLFWAKFSPEGKLLTIDSPIQKGLGYGKSLAVDPKGNFYWSGWFTEMLNLPSDLLFSKGNADLYLSRFRPESTN